MSQSSRKRGAAQVVRDPALYGDAFRRQYRLLVSLGAAFDAGDDDAAYPLSTTLRILLHDRLLDKVLKLKLLRLRDSAWDRPGGPNQAVGYGLTRMQVTTGVPGSGRVIPALDEVHNAPKVVFREWWGRDLSVFTPQVAVTREYAALQMANTDGGAHVDPSVDADYLHLLSQDAMFHFDGHPTEGNVLTASVRQIAWELQKTLEEDCSHLLS